MRELKRILWPWKQTVSEIENCYPLPARNRKATRLLLQWHTTDRCNLKCLHCYRDTTSSNGNHKSNRISHNGKDFTPISDSGQELSSKDHLRILEEYKTLLNSFSGSQHHKKGHINFTGGEPFLRTDFLSLLEKTVADRHLYSVGILTNGKLIDSSLAKQLKKYSISYLQVSLDGDREIHDTLRGEGDFDRTLDAIRICSAEGLSVSVSFTAHRGNINTLNSVAKVAYEAGADYLWSDRLIPEGTGDALREHCFSGEETRDYVKLLGEISQKYGETRNSTGIFDLWKRSGRRIPGKNRENFRVRNHRALQFLDSGDVPYRCSAGDSLLTVLSDGTVVPCRRMPLNVGNVLDQSLVEIYNENELLKKLRKHEIPDGCNHCLYRNDCNGGLRCLSLAIQSDPFARDPGCWLS